VILFDRLEVGVIHSFFGRNTLSMVILEHLAKQFDCLVGHKGIVLCVDELVPRLARMLSNDIIVVRIKGHVILLNVREKVFSAKYLGDLDKLVVVVLALEERFLLENHASEHASE